MAPGASIRRPQLADLISLRGRSPGWGYALHCISLRSMGMGIWIDEIELDEDVDEESNLEPPLPAGLEYAQRATRGADRVSRD